MPHTTSRLFSAAFATLSLLAGIVQGSPTTVIDSASAPSAEPATWEAILREEAATRQGYYLLELANEDALLQRLRHAGNLAQFTDHVLGEFLGEEGKDHRPNARDSQMAEFARRLDRLKESTLALRVWESLLTSFDGRPCSQFRLQYMRTLVAADPAGAPSRLIPRIVEVFIPQKVSSSSDYSPWYANPGSALAILDGIYDPALLRALLEENTVRLSTGNKSREALYYDLALRLRAGDTSAPAVFTAIGRDLRTSKEPSWSRGILEFFAGELRPLALWPDPTGEIEALFNTFLADLPAPDSPRDAVLPGALVNPHTALAVRLSWYRFLMTRGETARAETELANVADGVISGTYADQNKEILGLLLARGEVAGARRLYDFLPPHEKSVSEHLDDLLVAHERAPLNPALAIWTVPGEELGSLELRWEVTELRKHQRLSSQHNWLPPVFGLDRPGVPAGPFDLVVELTPEAGSPHRIKLELPSVPTRGRHKVTLAFPSGQLRAHLRPQGGGELLAAPPQLFSTLPNLLSNPTLRVVPATRPSDVHRIPGWSGSLFTASVSGGPSMGDQSTRIELRTDYSSRKSAHSDPISITPGSSYFLDGWVSRLPSHTGDISIEFLREDGSVLDRYNALWRNRLNELRWQRFAQAIASGSREDLRDSISPPAGTAAMRICLSGHGLTLANLSLRELPKPQPLPAAASQTSTERPPALQTGGLTELGAIAITSSRFSYIQNFNSLPSTHREALAWKNNETIPGWYQAYAGSQGITNAEYSYQVVPDLVTKGLTESYGVGANPKVRFLSIGYVDSSDRAIGMTRQNSAHGVIGAVFLNTSGATIRTASVGYRGEQWRRGGKDATSLYFEYRILPAIDGFDVNSPPSEWTRVPALEFKSLKNDGGNRDLDGEFYAAAIGPVSLAVDLAEGHYLALRWYQDRTTSAGAASTTFHAMAIDEVTFSASQSGP